MAKSLGARLVKPEELETALHAVVMQMRGNDYFRWIFRDPAAYIRAMPPFLRTAMEASIHHACACVVGDYAGLVALFPPGVEIDGTAEAEHWYPYADPHVMGTLSRQSAQLAELKPDKPHFRVLTLGADPIYRSSDVQVELMNFVRYKVEGYGVYWEITARPLIETYQQQGGVVLGEVQLENAPKVVAMWREPTKEKPRAKLGKTET